MPSLTVDAGVLPYTQEPGRYDYLVRIWGGDKESVCAVYDLHPNEGAEDSAVAVWFQTPRAVKTFLKEVRGRWSRLAAVERAADDGDVWTLTRARVVLRLPDGRDASFIDTYGYGYPWASVEFMWQEGNYSCDCNKALFLARQCAIGSEDDDHPCGDRIELVALEDISTRWPR